MNALQSSSNIWKQPRAVWAIGFACVIAFMGLGLVDPILPAIARKLDATESQVTLLFTSYNIVMAFAMLITGAISSRLGIKRTLLAGVVIIAIFSALGGLSNDIWELVGLRGGWGLGNALFVATALSAIVTFSRSGTAQAIILYEAAIGLGISVGPLLGGELGTLSWRGPFIGVSVLMIIAFILILILLPAQANPSAHTHKVPQRISIADPIRALKHRPLFILGLTALLYNFGFFTLLAYAPLVLGKMGLQERGLGYVFLGWGILLAATSVIMAPKLQKWFGTLKSMYGMLFLFSLSLFAIGQWTDSITVVVGAVVLAGAFLGNNNTLITTAVMQAAPVERATASAAYSFLRFIGGAIAPWLAGRLAEWFNPSVPFFVGGSFVLFSVVFIWLCRNQLHHIDRGEAAH